MKHELIVSLATGKIAVTAEHLEKIQDAVVGAKSSVSQGKHFCSELKARLGYNDETATKDEKKKINEIVSLAIKADAVNVNANRAAAYKWVDSVTANGAVPVKFGKTSLTVKLPTKKQQGEIRETLIETAVRDTRIRAIKAIAAKLGISELEAEAVIDGKTVTNV